VDEASWTVEELLAHLGDGELRALPELRRRYEVAPTESDEELLTRYQGNNEALQGLHGDRLLMAAAASSESPWG
jgi:hypothetical protein